MAACVGPPRRGRAVVRGRLACRGPVVVRGGPSHLAQAVALHVATRAWPCAHNLKLCRFVLSAVLPLGMKVDTRMKVQLDCPSDAYWDVVGASS